MQPTDVTAAIATELGLAPTAAPWLAALSPEAAVALLAWIREARADRRAALQRAIDEALAHVPRLLRAGLRKVLFT